MKCPVEIAHEMSAVRRAKVGEQGPYLVLLADRDGVGNESAGSHYAGEGEKIRGRQAAEKMARATGL